MTIVGGVAYSPHLKLLGLDSYYNDDNIYFNAPKSIDKTLNETYAAANLSSDEWITSVELIDLYGFNKEAFINGNGIDQLKEQVFEYHHQTIPTTIWEKTYIERLDYETDKNLFNNMTSHEFVKIDNISCIKIPLSKVSFDLDAMLFLKKEDLLTHEAIFEIDSSVWMSEAELFHRGVQGKCFYIDKGNKGEYGIYPRDSGKGSFYPLPATAENYFLSDIDGEKDFNKIRFKKQNGYVFVNRDDISNYLFNNFNQHL